MKKKTGSLSVRIRMCAAFMGTVLCLLAAGCAGKEGDTKVIFTTGPGKDEVFRIGDAICSVPEMMVYLTNTQNQYENVYGEEIWNTKLEDMTLEQNVKDTVLEKVAQIKTMYLLAKEKQITLSEEEEEKLEKAAAEYFGTLNQTERELIGVSQEQVQNLYKEYLLANKVYEEIIRDINPEISDDEARTITVQHILLRTTYTTQEGGEKRTFDDAKKREIYQKALEVRKQAVEDNEAFERLADEYSDDETLTYSFGKGELDEAFEQAAFALETGEVSKVITSDSGYHIMKCISTFNREETDLNKQKIVEKRRKEAFGLEYDAFVQKLARRLNDQVWEEVALIRDKEVVTDRFFAVYHAWFS